MQRFVVLILAIAVTGCATMFHTSDSTVEISGPENIRVTNQSGESLPLEGIGRHRTVTPERDDDQLSIEYAGKTQTVTLMKRTSPWVILDVLSYGFGFVIDDLSGKWFDYEPIEIHVDTASGFRVVSTNWLGESSESTRPSVLLSGGWGLSGSNRSDYSNSLALPPLVVGFHAEGGIGVDLGKRYEILARFADDEGIDLGEDSWWNARVGSQSLVGRYFFQKDLYGELSVGIAHAEIDSAIDRPDGTFDIQAAYSPTFPVMGFAVGWAGDISYIALCYQRSTRDFLLRDRLRTFTQASIAFGLNLRF